ncbi:hypothetical protein BC629DRAFT_1290145 [Irpex lacteus]|nr:hypothetical protein BC629DRAFT_1290145 [Irpex lacteus]
MASFTKALSPAIREIRILCCQTGAASQEHGQQFISSTYPVIKQHNPDLPILIREAKGTPARVFARFERGVEKHVDVENLHKARFSRRCPSCSASHNHSILPVLSKYVRCIFHLFEVTEL